MKMRFGLPQVFAIAGIAIFLQACNPIGEPLRQVKDSSTFGSTPISPVATPTPTPAPGGGFGPVAPTPVPTATATPSGPPPPAPTATPPLPTPGPSGYLADPIPSGRVLTVCPSSCMYTLPSQALNASVSQSGDTVEIRGGNYVDCSYITTNNITIRGISVAGVRPHIHSKVCGRKGVFVVTGNNVLFENLEISDAIDPTGADANWAGIRLDAGTGAKNVIVRNSYLHDADNGLLSGGLTPGILLIESSRFERLGRDGYAHGMYVGEMDQFILRNSVVVSNHDDGHLVKSRSNINIIECNMLAGLNGLNSTAIDLPQGGDSMIRKNVIQAGPNANTTRSFVNYAAENQNNAIQRISLQNNILINDKPMGAFFWFVGNPQFDSWSGNSLIGPGVPFLAGYASTATGFTQVSTRSAAGLSAFDGTVNSLPPQTFCP